MRNIKFSYLNYQIKIALFCCIISLFNLVQAIQLDTTQWQEVDITNNYIQQSFIQYSGESRYQDSLQLSQTKYANIVRDSNNFSGKILIQILDEYVKFYRKYSLTNTNVEGEFFFAYTSKTSSEIRVFFGFINESCNFSRGLTAPVQIADFTGINFFHLLAKTGKDNVYIITQNQSSFQYLYLMMFDISDTSTYHIKKRVKLGTIDFSENLFSIQAYSDDYAVIFAKDTNDKLQKITIKPNGIDVWDTPKDQGLFIGLNTNQNLIQNKIIQIENTNKYTIVTGESYKNTITIYTFQYIGSGIIQDICIETYTNQFPNVGDYFFYALEFGVINQNNLWIKGDNYIDDKKSVIFFANPLNCQIYKNPDDSSIYQYQLEHFGRSHIFHTYYSDQTVSLIASSSIIDGSGNQNLQAIRIEIGKNCPEYCASCIDYTNCDSCVSANIQRNANNQCSMQ
ncbi:hypothetical protein PPERSA_07207 [Pseudocohnilembus persalinus]|uniref:Insulin-like growth factor binding protein, N-terminal n=1 Tax=Pseudocohnilembus persalinus TaxID=266149 RepID=A0A0V0QD12_PSEPJ|nr:hypothetical protein PPERSA_07207 [Pseudocohnilembus persalinus]|eukprot:KRX00100.1 hypothetical protein PPERSA_07207 [Pseudocohnilembus persalinus]